MVLRKLLHRHIDFQGKRLCPKKNMPTFFLLRELYAVSYKKYGNLFINALVYFFYTRERFAKILLSVISAYIFNLFWICYFARNWQVGSRVGWIQDIVE